MMNGGPGAFSGSFNLSEIWQFPVSSGGQSGALLGLRTPQFEQNGMSQFGHSSGTNQEADGDHPLSMELRVNQSGTRKHRDVDDESTSNGDGGSVCVSIHPSS